MRAGHYTLVTLNAVIGDPFRNARSNTAFFKLGGCRRQRTIERHLGNRNVVALLEHGRQNYVFREVGRIRRKQFRRNIRLADAVRNRNFFDRCNGSVNRLPVHFNDIHPFTFKGFLGRRFNQINRFVGVKNTGEFKEGGLHDGVNTSAKADFHGNLQRVHVVELNFAINDDLLLFLGEVREHFVRRDFRVQQEHTAFFQRSEHVVTTDVSRVVTRNKVRIRHEERVVHFAVAETQMRNRYAAGLLGVVCKVRLCILFSRTADDLNGVLVRADRTVSTETPEHAGNNIVRHNIDVCTNRNGKVGYVIFDTDREAVPRTVIDVVVTCFNHGRSEFLGGKAVTAADNLAAFAFERSNNVEVKRLTEIPRLFGAVENDDLLRGFRNAAGESFCRERTVQTHLNETQLCALRVQLFNRRFNRVTGRTHGNDHLLGIYGADIVEQIILAAELGCKGIHVFLNNSRNRVIVFVGCFTTLEVNIGVLSSNLQVRRFRLQRAGTETFNVFRFNQILQVVVGDFFHLLNFVRSTETVKEVQERNLRFQRGKMSNRRHIHRFLNRAGAGHCPTGVAHRHDVGVVTENGERLGRQRTGGHVENGRQHLAGNLIHIGDHQKKTLRGRESGGQCTGAQRTVNRTGGTRFRLHFDYVNRCAEKIFLSLAGPLFRIFAHIGGRRNRIDRCHVGEGIRNMRCRCVTIDGYHFFTHATPLS